MSPTDQPTEPRPDKVPLIERIWSLVGTHHGHVVSLFGAAVGWLALWAAFDVAVVVLAFPPPLSARSVIDFYWFATWDFMFPLASMFAFRQHAWLPIAAQRAGAWEDVLFYLIQGKGVPAVVTNIPPTGTAGLVYARVIVFMGIALLVEIESHRIHKRGRVVASGIALLVAVVLDNWYGLFLCAAIGVYFVFSWALKAAGTQYVASRKTEEDAKKQPP